MRRLLCTRIIALIALLAGPILFNASAYACDDRFPSCIGPKAQDVQDPADADDAAVASEPETPPARANVPLRPRRTHRATERRRSAQSAASTEGRPSAQSTPAGRRSEPPPRAPEPAPAVTTVPWWLEEAPAAQWTERLTPAPGTGAISTERPTRDSFGAAASPGAMVDGSTDRPVLANPHQVELAAGSVPADPTEAADLSWLHGLLAVVGGALAAGSAARLLLV